jgi:hypothetical protein
MGGDILADALGQTAGRDISMDLLGQAWKLGVGVQRFQLLCLVPDQAPFPSLHPQVRMWGGGGASFTHTPLPSESHFLVL